MVSTQCRSMARRRSAAASMYKSSTTAMPETMAEKRNTTGMSGVDHQGLALTEPKMNPT